MKSEFKQCATIRFDPGLVKIILYIIGYAEG